MRVRVRLRGRGVVGGEDEDDAGDEDDAVAGVARVQYPPCSDWAVRTSEKIAISRGNGPSTASPAAVIRA